MNKLQKSVQDLYSEGENFNYDASQNFDVMQGYDASQNYGFDLKKIFSPLHPAHPSSPANPIFTALVNNGVHPVNAAQTAATAVGLAPQINTTGLANAPSMIPANVAAAMQNNNKLVSAPGVTRLNISIDASAAGTATTIAHTVELFNNLYSCVKLLNTNIAAALPTWSADGKSLVIVPEAGKAITISGSPVPYRVLFDASSYYKMIIGGIRYSYLNQAQLDNALYSNWNSFMGKVESDSVLPKDYFDPDQQQSLTVDITNIDFKIDAERGMTQTINAAEKVGLNLYITRFERIVGWAS